jgi:hypothetical protein
MPPFCEEAIMKANDRQAAMYKGLVQRSQQEYQGCGELENLRRNACETREGSKDLRVERHICVTSENCSSAPSR